MNKIIKILMERDDLTREEATDIVKETRDMIYENMDEAEDILLCELGLEMDYIFDLIYQKI